jgi:hypothetical protein
MFADASTLRRAPVLLLALVSVALFCLTGCGEDEVVDPYVYTTLERVMDGDTLSTNFLFEIDAPEALEYAKGDVGLIRKGNRLEFMVAPDIEHNFASYRGSLLGVQKRFTHGADTPHLFLMRTKSGEIITPVDSVEAYVLPSVFTASKTQIETPGAPLPDLDWTRVSGIEQYYPENEGDSLIEVQSIVEKFVYSLKYDLTEQELENPQPHNYAWYAIFEKSTFELTGLDEGAGYMLELLEAQNLPLVGSFSIESIESERRERRKDREGLGHVCGDMKVNWFKYANTYIHGEG